MHPTQSVPNLWVTHNLQSTAVDSSSITGLPAEPQLCKLPYIIQTTLETTFLVYLDIGYVMIGGKKGKNWEREGKLPFESSLILRARFLKCWICWISAAKKSITVLQGFPLSSSESPWASVNPLWGKLHKKSSHMVMILATWALRA